MDSFFTGSVQSWLAVAVTTLGPLIALIVGFEGADWFFRRQFSLAKTAAQGPRRRDNEVGRPGYADSRNP